MRALRRGECERNIALQAGAFARSGQWTVLRRQARVGKTEAAGTWGCSGVERDPWEQSGNLSREASCAHTGLES